jgi:hypothetical protein
VAHNLQDGEQVMYQTDAGAAVVGGLTSGVSYTVTRVDAFSIKLSDVDYPAEKSFSGMAITDDKVTLATHGFADNQAVTYRAPGASEFGLRSVDVVGGAYSSDSPATNTSISAPTMV